MPTLDDDVCAFAPHVVRQLYALQVPSSEPHVELHGGVPRLIAFVRRSEPGARETCASRPCALHASMPA